MARKLRCSDDHHWIGGVCAGVAYWVGIPVWLVRLGWTLVSLYYGAGVVPYLLLWIFLPSWEHDPADFETVTGD
ncbi:PspC domain-containing protein [Candidatus Uhrbacteria bacterium]|nr:PspC domain-containing protein [Candidatus Uhrbacteria bacterium]